MSSISSSSSARSLLHTPETIYKLLDLRLATNDFSDEKIIVQGEFGITYQVILDNGEIVAVKRYDVAEIIIDKFRYEIQNNAKIHHNNLIALKGTCEDNSVSHEMIIVHEFMKFGTLSDHLLGDGVVKEINLSWEQRLMICINVALALRYLHDGARKLIHRNVNPLSILLDENWTAKLSESGLSKVGKSNTEHSAMKTDAKGTNKYIDPFYIQTGMITRKSDVYSFGVVLIDVLFGKKNFYGHISRKKGKLLERTQKCLNEGGVDGIIDKRLKGQISPLCLRVFSELAFTCLNNTNPKLCPTMTDVREKLEYCLEISKHTRSLELNAE